MAIKKYFAGSTIRHPGAYSITKTSPDAGANTADTGILLLIGEADAGPSGASEGLQVFSASAFNQLKSKYRTGPLVDCAKVALAPSRSPGISGASTFIIWKTNTSTQAELALANSYDTVKALEFGVGGNRITYQNIIAAEGEISVTGTAVITDFAGLDTKTLIVRKNGGSAVTCTFATPADMAAVISQINAALTGIVASSDTGKLKLTMTAATDHHRDGFGSSFEIVSGSALAILFLASQTVIPVSEPTASIKVIQPRDGITEQATVGGDIVVQIGRDSSDTCTAANVTITDSVVTLTATGSTNYTLNVSDYPLVGNLVDAISALPGWSVSTSALFRSLPVSALDNVSAIGAYSTIAGKPARIKIDAYKVKEFFDSSVLVEITGAPKGLPDAEGTSNLSSGVKGASSSSAFDAGLSAALGTECNVIVPCVSQDASADILLGVTDPSSTYDIETIHAMLATHLSLRGSIKNKKEAQGVVGYRKQAKLDVFTQAATLGSFLVQMCMDDVLVVDSTNELAWKQPHVAAAIIGGMRCGSPIGEPLTFKFAAVSGIGHYVNASTGIAQGDFNPLIDFDAAIDAGVTCLEPAAGGWRVMVDNTTYGIDGNFVWNRGSVIEAAQYSAKYIRSDAELAFVGQKTAIVTASAIKSRIRSRLSELFANRITSPSTDAPLGYKEASFIVSVVGNTATVELEILPVQGLDFIFVTFTLGESRTSA